MGMTHKEFDKFAACLPEAYQKRFARLGTFDKLSNNKDILEYADFEMVLDVFAEMIVDDVDIEIDIVNDEESELPTLSAPLTVSEEQDSYLSDEEDGGFLSKLNTWRQGRKQEKIRSSANVSRHVIKRSITRKGSNAFGAFNLFGGLSGGIQSGIQSGINAISGKGNKDPTDDDEKKVKSTHLKPMPYSGDNDDDGNELIVEQPKTIKTASAIDGIEAKHIDNASLDDNDINAYMEKMNQQNQGNESVLSAIDDGNEKP